MKRRVLGVLLAAMCVTAVPSVAYAGLYATPSDAAQTEAAATDAGTDAAAPAEEAAPAEAAATAETAPATEAADSAAPAETTTEAAPAGTLSDNLYDFQIKIGDTVYQIPMTYADFMAQGWTIGSNHSEDETISANYYDLITCTKDSNDISVEFLNLQINEIPLNQTLVGGIRINGVYDLNLDMFPVEFAKGIQMGKSNLQDIEAAYGTPTSVYEGNMYTQYRYEKDTYQEIEFYVYSDDNTLKQVEIQNFTEPEGFDKGSVSTETPDIVTSYVAPTALGEDMLDPQVEFCGDLYSLPAPVSAFLDNGWQFVDATDDQYVDGRGLDHIKMVKDNQTVSFSVYNEIKDAALLKNCFVESLSVGTYDSDALSLNISGGISLGTSRADIEAAANAKGYICYVNDNYLSIYKTEDSKYDTKLTLWFNPDADPDKVADIEYRNGVLPQQ